MQDIRIKLSTGGRAMAGLIALDSGMDVDTRIRASADYEVAQATDSAIRVLSALGVGSHGSDGDEAAVGTTSESVPPEAFGESDHETAYPEHTPKPATQAHPYDEAARVSETGDAVRVVFEDNSTRLYLDTGQALYSPDLDARGMAEHTLAYADKSIRYQRVVERLGDDTLRFEDGGE
ncbi:hypothetical protein QDA04_gp60 [Microbacterium phage Megan]|uniref:KTSC domain-containing protein n=1 Tax=Microbacterium phage Megan TaxID=2656551 RepID=A0A649VK14_9CAUD|nr:hypothetical protein QDA04_gp60 [Microbacterium phage Megan]QGJ92730.1 hypothetical protein PBI_MEGAN_60 [Microbacterium phage Megan]